MALEPALEKLIQNLKTGEDSTRVSAARELGLTGTPDCIPYLEEALSDSNFGVQASSENAIVRIKKRVEQEAHEKSIREKKEAEEAKIKEAAEKEEARRLAQEEEEKKKEICIEELLSEEEIQRIKLEEIKKMELTKQQKTEDLKRLEKQRKKQAAKKLEELKKLEEEKRKKAEELLREKIRAQAGEQKGLIEHEGKWITPEELEVIKQEENEVKAQKENSFKRLKMRKRKEHKSKIDSLAGQKEEGLVFLFNCIFSGLVGGLILLILGFTVYKPLLSISSIFLIITIIGLIIVMRLIYDNEKNIYKLRIYEIDEQEFTLKIKVSEKWLLKFIRTLVLKFNSDLNSRFSPTKKARKKTKDDSKSE